MRHRLTIAQASGFLGALLLVTATHAARGLTIDDFPMGEIRAIFAPETIASSLASAEGILENEWGAPAARIAAIDGSPGAGACGAPPCRQTVPPGGAGRIPWEGADADLVLDTTGSENFDFTTGGLRDVIAMSIVPKAAPSPEHSAPSGKRGQVIRSTSPQDREVGPEGSLLLASERE